MNRWFRKAANLCLLGVRWGRYARRQPVEISAADFRTWVRTSLLARPELLEIPWLTLPAVRWLQTHARPDWTVFEWGSGASTLALAPVVSRLVSIEHDRAWHRRIADQLRLRRLENVLLLLVEPVPGVEGVPERYLSSSPKDGDVSFQNYASAIDAWPDASFDLVLVDGRARAGCLAHAVVKVRPGGAILLDNAERPAYASAIQQLETAGWRRDSLVGPVPRCPWPAFADTSVFTRREPPTSSGQRGADPGPPRR